MRRVNYGPVNWYHSTPSLLHLILLLSKSKVSSHHRGSLFRLEHLKVPSASLSPQAWRISSLLCPLATPLPRPQGPNRAETTPGPAFIVLGSLSISVPISVVSQDIISAAPLHLFVHSAVSRTAYIQHTLGSTSMSASAVVLFHISSRVFGSTHYSNYRNHQYAVRMTIPISRTHTFT